MTEPVIAVRPLGFPWETFDPFLFCVHHDDAYPAGNESFGPMASLSGRRIGMDFEGKDGWRMYHGETVPGFPQHPHRGFETVTVVRRGLVDHSDSLGAAARYGEGDVQWLTAGHGIVHSEMFPLLDGSAPNPLELFQIWLNLPGADKLVDPHFSMLWGDKIPRRAMKDRAGRTTKIAAIAGELDGAKPPPPPPHSWASRPDSQVVIWTLELEPGAELTLPKAPTGVNRTLYFFTGPSIKVGATTLPPSVGARLRPELEAQLVNGPKTSELLLLQGRPIGEPVVQYGPFVMQTRGEIQQAFSDYQRTGFGGWPWPSDGPVHGKDPARFARHADGKVERAAT
ncbi:MAG: pirin family protein [Deltaproteobacteria bacterium]|nr:pirin family protein [Deltaproteobacteria bacterium]